MRAVRTCRWNIASPGCPGIVRLGEATISSNLRSNLPPAHPQDAAVQVDVFPAGQFRVKAGSDLEQAADPTTDLARPDVGSVIRLRIFSRVDLPAPLRPIIPTTSPG